ncbi:MAG TPA: SRPBCC family protein [Terracidiphilus sp.]|nr:SRPBCC family protein [Terracidiphilus sp.]
MPEPAVTHSTFVVERTYPQSPDRVFASFAHPARKRRWYAEGDHEIQEYDLDFRVGGNERFRYRFKEGHPIAGSEINNESTYHDIVPQHRIVFTQKMALNGKPVSIAVITLEFLVSSNGTDLILTNQGTFLDWPDGAKMVEHGWNSLLDRLRANVVA